MSNKHINTFPASITHSQIKAAMRFYYTPPGGLTLKELAIPGVGNDVEQWKFSYTMVEVEIGTNAS